MPLSIERKNKQTVFQKFLGFCTGYYNILLCCLVLLFIFRPYSRGPTYLFIWKTLLIATLLAAIFNCNHQRVVRWAVFLLAIPPLIFAWLVGEEPSTSLIFVNALATILFLVVCTSSIIYDAVLKPRVTAETLKGVVCAYFLIGFMFAYIYFLINYLIPSSFFAREEILQMFSFAHYLSEMVYFSFITLLTIGFGDVTPAKDVAQTFVIIEGIIGQFYIAILVSRLVSLYAGRRLLNSAKKSSSSS